MSSRFQFSIGPKVTTTNRSENIGTAIF